MPNLTFLAPTIPEIWRGPKISKVDHVTPSRTANGGRRWPDILIPRPRFAYSLYNFHGATMTIKGSLQASIPIIKAPFSRFLVQNLAGSRDLWIGGRRWPHIWIPWPRLVYSLYNFHWATMTIKGSLQASIENSRKICVFWGKIGSKCKILFLRPPKGTSLCKTASFDILIVKIGAVVLAVGCRKNQKNLNQSHLMCIFTYLRDEGGQSYRDEILHRGRRPRRNHPCKFWWRSVQGFLREQGSNFPLFHWLALSSLKHSGMCPVYCTLH